LRQNRFRIDTASDVAAEFALGPIHPPPSIAEAVAHAMPFIASAVKWTVEALLFGIIGLLIGGMLIPTIGGIAAPAWKFAKGFRYKRGQ
jgi:predicted DNA repair protein MutK